MAPIGLWVRSSQIEENGYDYGENKKQQHDDYNGFDEMLSSIHWHSMTPCIEKLYS